MLYSEYWDSLHDETCPQGADVGGRCSPTWWGNFGNVPQHVGPTVGVPASARNRPQPKCEDAAPTVRRERARTLCAVATLSLSAHPRGTPKGMCTLNLILFAPTRGLYPCFFKYWVCHRSLWQKYNLTCYRQES